MTIRLAESWIISSSSALEETAMPGAPKLPPPPVTLSLTESLIISSTLEETVMPGAASPVTLPPPP